MTNMLEQHLSKILDQNQALIAKVAELHQLPAALERISRDVSTIKDSISDIRQNIAVHSSRLETQERDADRLKTMLENNRRESEKDSGVINARIEEIESDLRSEISTSQNEVLTKLTEVVKAQNENHAAITARLGALEKWIWTAIGGGLVVVWILEHYVIPNIGK